jgi:hypothetical protein
MLTPFVSKLLAASTEFGYQRFGQIVSQRTANNEDDGAVDIRW